MKLEFDVLYGRSSAETKRQLDEVVRDDVALLDESPVHTSTSGRRSRKQRIRATLERLAKLRTPGGDS